MQYKIFRTDRFGHVVPLVMRYKNKEVADSVCAQLNNPDFDAGSNKVYEVKPCE